MAVEEFAQCPFEALPTGVQSIVLLMHMLISHLLLMQHASR
jgi:hypothetical protein